MKKKRKITKILLSIVSVILSLSILIFLSLFILDRTDLVFKFFGRNSPEQKPVNKMPLVFDLSKQNRIQETPEFFLPKIGIDYHALELQLQTRQDNFTSKAPLDEGKIIEIDLSSQRFLIWQNGKLEGNWLTSTGRRGRDTRIGIFEVLDKYEMATGVGPDGEFWEMPKWLGIYYAGGSENGIHALARVDGYQVGAGVLGYPSTNGCISLGFDAAKKVYDWAEIGTIVMIHW